MTVRVAVIGCGYLGTTTAACLADFGFEILGVDRDEDRVRSLADGEMPFFEPELGPLLKQQVRSGMLRFTTSYQEAADFADLYLLCLATPQRGPDDYRADLSQLTTAIDTLAPLLTRESVIVGKSTVPVGTAATIAARATELAPAGHLVHVAWNPEFLREGHAVNDTKSPDRLVIGVATRGVELEKDGLAERLLREVYAKTISPTTPVLVCDYATAELVKSAANAFLATKISFINAMAELCETTGADVTMLSEALGSDPRIGRHFLKAGLGFGGGCLPKDLRAFIARADELGANEALTFLGEVDAINQRRRQRVVDMAAELLDDRWDGARIGVLGAAFKPDSDDVRDSPALDVASRLQRGGADVRVYDPKAMSNASALWPKLTYADSTVAACEGAHVVLMLTEWREFQELSPETLNDVVANRAIVDGRSCLDAQPWRENGWVYRSLGRP